MLILLLQSTTQPAAPPVWVSSTVLLIGAITTLVLALGGGAGIMALLNALRNFRRQTNAALNQLNVSSNENRTKINEVAQKNPADVDPLPPSPPLIMPATDAPLTIDTSKPAVPAMVQITPVNPAQTTGGSNASATTADGISGRVRT